MSTVQWRTHTGTVCDDEALKHLMQLRDINTNTGGEHKVCIIDLSGSFICSGREGGLGVGGLGGGARLLTGK